MFINAYHYNVDISRFLVLFYISLELNLVYRVLVTGAFAGVPYVGGCLVFSESILEFAELRASLISLRVCYYLEATTSWHECRQYKIHFSDTCNPQHAPLLRNEQRCLCFYFASYLNAFCEVTTECIKPIVIC